MRADRAILCCVFAAAVLAGACTKEEIKSTYSKQETNIENFTNTVLKAVDTAYVVYNRGTTRVVVVPGEGDSLKVNGTVSFYYAGYVINSSTINSSSLFATNNANIAAESDWTLSEENYEPLTVKLNDSDFVDGLKYGLEGVKAGQECYILFSGKYGFGKKPLGTIPANAALAYHIWVDSVSND